MADPADGDYQEEHAGQEQPAENTPQAAADRKVVDDALDDFELISSVESEQRRREDAALEFEGVQVWSQDAKDNRAEQTDDSTGQTIPARPTIEINLTEMRVQQITGEARQARLGLSVQPRAGLANTKQSDYYRGLMRSVQSESGAGEVRLWALDRAVKCGRGAYRLDVRYTNDGDQTTDPEGVFDLDIVIDRILDQSTVYWDPYSVCADRRDATVCIITDWISEKERKRRWPAKPIIPSAGAFESDNHPWFAIDADKNKRCRIATVYRVLFSDEHAVHHPKLGVVGPMSLEKLPQPIQDAIASKHPGLRHRIIPKRRVMQYIIDGSQVLEQDPWLGRYIPVVPVTGKEYNIKGKRSWKGVVENLMDLNRAYAVTISSAVEMAASMPRAPYLMYAGQDSGFEDMWDDSPIKAYTRLYVNRLDVEGQPAPFPERQNLEPAIQGALVLARTLKDDIGTVSGNVDPTSRALNPNAHSGKAIDLLQQQGAAGTSNFVDNLATVSMPQEGRIFIDLAPRVYDRPGRRLGIMGEDHDDEISIILKTPFVRDKDGNPVPVPCPTCQGQGVVAPPRSVTNWFPVSQTCSACQGLKQATRENMPETYNHQPVEYVDLSDGQFKVIAEIGRNYQTKQEEAMNAMSQLATAAPPLVPIYADLWVRSMGFSGSTEIADRIKAQNPHAKDDGKAQSVPPEFQAKFQELQQQHQQAMQQLQQATQALQTDAVKTAGAKEMLGMKLEAASNLEHIKQQFKLMEEEASGKAVAEVEQMRGSLKTMAEESAQRHEILLEMLTARHAMDRDLLKAETTIAAAEEAAKVKDKALFYEERARIGVDAIPPKDQTPQGGA